MLAIQKDKNLRNRKLLDLAHLVNECQFRLPTCIGYVPHGCEPIHSDHQEHGKGMGIKASDDQHVAGCHNCHLFYSSGKLSRSEKFNLFNKARVRTFALYAKNRWLEKVGYVDVKRVA